MNKEDRVDLGTYLRSLERYISVMGMNVMPIREYMRRVLGMPDHAIDAVMAPRIDPERQEG